MAEIVKSLLYVLEIVMPLIIGSAIALIVNVPMGFLEKRLWKKRENKILLSLRRPVAFLISFVFIIGIFVGVLAIVLPTFVETVTVIVRSVIEHVNRLNSMTDAEIADLPLGEIILKVDWNHLVESAKEWLADRAALITNTVFGTVTSLVGGMMDAFVAIVFSVYILFNKEKIKKQAKRIVNAWLPKKTGEWTYHAVSVLSVSFKNFISAQFLESIIVGVLCFIGMIIFGFPYAGMVSVLIGVTALVPIVGGFIGCGIGAFMMLTIDPVKALWFIVFFIALQQIEGNTIYPKVMGSRVKLPSMWILAAVTVGGGIGGAIGMLLAVPIASTVYTLFKEETVKRELKLNAVPGESGSDAFSDNTDTADSDVKED